MRLCPVYRVLTVCGVCGVGVRSANRSLHTQPTDRLLGGAFFRLGNTDRPTVSRPQDGAGPSRSDRPTDRVPACSVRVAQTDRPTVSKPADPKRAKRGELRAEIFLGFKCPQTRFSLKMKRSSLERTTRHLRKNFLFVFQVGSLL